MALKKRKDGRYEKGVTIDGKVVHFYGKTQREVNEKIMAYKRKKQNGVKFEQLRSEYYEDYLRDHPSSRRALKKHIERLTEFFGDEYAKDISAKDVTSFLWSLDLSLKTVKACKSYAKCIFDYGIREYGLTENPAAYRQMPKHLERNVRLPPTEEELDKIKESIDAPYRLFFLIALYTGLRRGEILALQYKDIDREANVIRVTKSVYHDGNEPVIKEPKTEKGKREVILLEPLKELLPDGKPNDYIFGGRKPWSSHEAQRHIYAYQKAVGIDVTPHQLRHAYATILYEAGIDERMSMELLGHANIATTRDIYTHITRNKQKDSADKLNSFLSSKFRH